MKNEVDPVFIFEYFLKSKSLLFSGTIAPQRFSEIVIS